MVSLCCAGQPIDYYWHEGHASDDHIALSVEELMTALKAGAGVTGVRMSTLGCALSFAFGYDGPVKVSFDPLSTAGP